MNFHKSESTEPLVTDSEDSKQEDLEVDDKNSQGEIVGTYLIRVPHKEI